MMAETEKIKDQVDYTSDEPQQRKDEVDYTSDEDRAEHNPEIQGLVDPQTTMKQVYEYEMEDELYGVNTSVKQIVPSAPLITAHQLNDVTKPTRENDTQSVVNME